ncbi:hypothetical protein NCU84_13890, partial [Acinetobacter baumannii]
YYAINIPKKVDYALIKKCLDDKSDFLDYEESCLSDSIQVICFSFYNYFKILKMKERRI